MTRDRTDDQKTAGNTLGLVTSLAGAYGFISAYEDFGVNSSGNYYIAGSAGLLTATALFGSDTTYDSMKDSYQTYNYLIVFPTNLLIYLFKRDIYHHIGGNGLNFLVGSLANLFAGEILPIVTNQIHDYIYPEVETTGLHHSWSIDYTG
jgi:hypothetical protein